ncbi:MAG: hypothetical protein QGH42_11865 [Kiritimatiellia bacterium]|nr:hypothetical protein [Kiritimatiellia bacterium]MDP6811375.1 hypothetical protein [Kiritimatiellia bacterium]MDP7024921.1 hypothetical protein [Kiritimatiellia bacterium]
MNRYRLWLLSVLAVLGMAGDVVAQGDVPRAHGAARLVDTPILRVPFLSKAPEIDGVMGTGEWGDASALSAFWYDFHFGTFRFAAPQQTQLQIYAGYDRENLYICYSSPVYPEGSWLKARGRFPDVLEHPLYGMIEDDHVEMEIRPVGDLSRGYDLGMMRWDVNPIGTVTDWYYSRDGGRDFGWSSGAKIRSKADEKRWVIEYQIPLKSFRYGKYDARGADGQPLVSIPPRDGSAFRAWFARGIGHNDTFFNAFDQHGWDTTKTMLVFDSKAPVFQVNELGPLMEGKVDLEMTVKNHNTRSETVRVGFYVESPWGPIYSSYQSAETPGGLLELSPGESRTLRLKHELEGVETDGNMFWFGVRSVGDNPKVLFRTRLVGFHLMDGGAAGSPPMSFRERRLDAIEKLRPKRIPYFDMQVSVSPYTKRVAALCDRGIKGVKEQIKTAVEAQMIIHRVGARKEEIHECRAPVVGDFALLECAATNLVSGEEYEVEVIMYDENMKIVGSQIERRPFHNLTFGADPAISTGRGERFNSAPWMKTATSRGLGSYNSGSSDERKTRLFETPPWLNGNHGLEDRVWEPFAPIVQTRNGFETLKHSLTIDDSGLPAQIDIRPDRRELPLELRGANAKVDDATLSEVGRGPQFRAPLRLEAVVDGKRVQAQVVDRAKAVRVWKSEIEYASRLRVGPVDAELVTRYDCDGSLHASLRYGGETAVRIERLELVADIAGKVDLMLSETFNGPGETGADRGDCVLPNRPGVLWDSTMTKMSLFYSRFIPWFWFGSADRGWSYYSPSDEGWILDRDGSAMQIERDQAGDVTWRVVFVNHPAEIKGSREIKFSILTHPAKPKPVNFRQIAWHHFVGQDWAASGRQEEDYDKEPNFVPYIYSEEDLLRQWRKASSAPADIPEAHREDWRSDTPLRLRWDLEGGAGFFLPERDRLFEDKALYYLERFIRLGRRDGLWMGALSPPDRSANLGMGNAYARDPRLIGENELAIQATFLTENTRSLYKRLLRVHAKHGVPPRHHVRSHNAARLLEAYAWNSALFRETGAAPKAYEIDLLTRYPNSLYRTMAMNYTGLITTLLPDRVVATSGDNMRFDRQMLGLGLLHDFGVTRDAQFEDKGGGPEGSMQHQEQGVRLLSRLGQFGFFNDVDTEKIPFWRNDAIVRMGETPAAESRVRVTVYRRPLDNGKGYKAIFVILNESDGDIALPLNIRDTERIFAGPNTLRGGDVLGRASVPTILKAAWAAGADDRSNDLPVLMDLETGGMIARESGNNERYGPVYVPYHDYRVLYGEGRGE